MYRILQVTGNDRTIERKTRKLIGVIHFHNNYFAFDHIRISSILVQLEPFLIQRFNCYSTKCNFWDMISKHTPNLSHI